MVSKFKIGDLIGLRHFFDERIGLLLPSEKKIIF